jgi:hypothetical protein
VNDLKEMHCCSGAAVDTLGKHSRSSQMLINPEEAYQTVNRSRLAYGLFKVVSGHPPLLAAR